MHISYDNPIFTIYTWLFVQKFFFCQYPMDYASRFIIIFYLF